MLNFDAANESITFAVRQLNSAAAESFRVQAPDTAPNPPYSTDAMDVGVRTAETVAQEVQEKVQEMFRTAREAARAHVERELLERLVMPPGVEAQGLMQWLGEDDRLASMKRRWSDTCCLLDGTRVAHAIDEALLARTQVAREIDNAFVNQWDYSLTSFEDDTLTYFGAELYGVKLRLLEIQEGAESRLASSPPPLPPRHTPPPPPPPEDAESRRASSPPPPPLPLPPHPPPEQNSSQPEQMSQQPEQTSQQPERVSRQSEQSTTRISRMLTRMQNNSQCAFDITRMGSDYQLQAVFDGPPQTPYGGGRFVVSVSLSSEFPFAPPQIRFLTRVFHPNVSTSGVIWLDALGEYWQSIVGLGAADGAVKPSHSRVSNGTSAESVMVHLSLLVVYGGRGCVGARAGLAIHAKLLGGRQPTGRRARETQC